MPRSKKSVQVYYFANVGWSVGPQTKRFPINNLWNLGDKFTKFGKNVDHGKMTQFDF